MWLALGSKLGQVTFVPACVEKQQIVKMLVNQKGNYLFCGRSSCNYIPAQYMRGISVSGFRVDTAASQGVI